MHTSRRLTRATTSLAAALAATSLCASTATAAPAPTPWPTSTPNTATPTATPTIVDQQANPTPTAAPDRGLRPRTSLFHWAPMYTEADQTFPWGGQKHYLRTVKGQLRHWWQEGNDGPVGTENFPGTGYVGVPIGYHWNAPGHPQQQQYFARTSSGAIKHFWWGDDGSGLHHNEWVANNAASDPAAGQLHNQQHLFYTDKDGHLQHMWWSPQHPGHVSKDCWTQRLKTESGVELRVKGTPSIFQWGGQQHVYVRTANNGVAHIWWDDSRPNHLHHHIHERGDVASDIATLAGEGRQTHYFVTTSGHLISHTWQDAEGNKPAKQHPPVNMTASDPARKSVTGQPAVFKQWNQEHALVRTVDGGISHYWAWPEKPEADVAEWAPAGSTDGPIAAGLMDGDPHPDKVTLTQDLYYTDRAGQIHHAWWSPSTNFQRTTVGTPTPDHAAPQLPTYTTPGLKAASNGTNTLYITDTAASGSSFIHFTNSITTFPGGVETDPLDTSQLPAGSLAPWISHDNVARITTLRTNGDLATMTEQRPGSGRFHDAWTPGYLDAVSGVTTTPNTDGNADATVLAGHSADGIVVARPTSGNWLKWLPLPGTDASYTGVTVARSQGNDAHLYADRNGRLVAGALAHNSQNVTWTELPTLPGGVTRSGGISAMGYPDGKQRVAVLGSDRRVYTLTQDASGWQQAWTALDGAEGDGTPHLAYDLSHTSAVIVLRTTDNAGVFARETTPQGTFEPFKRITSASNTAATFASDPLFISHQRGGRPSFSIVGKNAQNQLIGGYPALEARRDAEPGTERLTFVTITP